MMSSNLTKIPTIFNHIMDYVRQEGGCEPDQAELIDDDSECPVWKVTVKSFGPTWEVPPPKFWYVCPKPGLNLYRNDSQCPQPWKSLEEQDEETVIDHIKSFHLGMISRLFGKATSKR